MRTFSPFSPFSIYLSASHTKSNYVSNFWTIKHFSDRLKQDFVQTVASSVLLYGCNTWTLIKRLKKKLDGNKMRMLHALFNKSWKQHPTKLRLYSHLPPILKTIQARGAKDAGHCLKNKDELISNVLIRTAHWHDG